MRKIFHIKSKKLMLSLITLILLVSVIPNITLHLKGHEIMDPIYLDPLSSPIDIAYFEEYNRMYVLDKGTDSVSVIDCYTNTEIATIPVGDYPQRLSVGHVNHRVFVTNSNDDSITIISTYDNTVEDTIYLPEGSYPIGIDYYKYTKIFVACNGDDVVRVIDFHTHDIIDVIPAGENPYDLVVNPTTNKIYVTNDRDGQKDRVSVIRGANGKVIDVIDVGGGARSLALDKVRNMIYVCNYYDNSISVIDGSSNTVTTTINVSDEPKNIDFHNKLLYVPNQGDGNITVINTLTNKVILEFDAWQPSSGASFPSAVAYNTLNNILYVTHYLDGVVSPIYFDPYITISTDKDQYLPGETVILNITAYNPSATKAWPDAELELELTWPTDDDYEIFNIGYPIPPNPEDTLTSEFEIPDSMFIPNGEYTFTTTLIYDVDKEISESITIYIDRF